MLAIDWDTAIVIEASAVHWGDVPTWIAAIGTAGALLLGFYILLRDRRKEERRQAMRVVITTQTSPRDGGSPAEVNVTLHNTSDQPIQVPFAQAVGRQVKQMRAQLRKRDTPGAQTLLPRLEGIERITSITAWGYDIETGTNTTLEAGARVNMTLRLDYPSWCYDYSVVFTDATGQVWVRDQQLNKLQPFKSATRIYLRSKRLTQWKRAWSYRSPETKRFFL